MAGRKKATQAAHPKAPPLTALTRIDTHLKTAEACLQEVAVFVSSLPVARESVQALRAQLEAARRELAALLG